MIAKALKDYKQHNQITVINVAEEVEIMAQKISKIAPEHFPHDGVNTYQIALDRVRSGYSTIPYCKLALIIIKNKILKIFQY